MAAAAAAAAFSESTALYPSPEQLKRSLKAPVVSLSSLSVSLRCVWHNVCTERKACAQPLDFY